MHGLKWVYAPALSLLFSIKFIACIVFLGQLGACKFDIIGYALISSLFYLAFHLRYIFIWKVDSELAAVLTHLYKAANTYI